MSQVCRADVQAVPQPELAARDKDVIILATSSREPVISSPWVADGTHINAIGSNFLAKSEMDINLLKRCKPIVVDSKDQARIEAGDFTQALEDGSLHWSDIRELGQIVVGKFPGRVRDQDISLFKSVGIAIEDVAVAAKVYAKAKAEGIGREVEW
jgi:ornithine cyclodeaminase/alanine dehydrogenase